MISSTRSVAWTRTLVTAVFALGCANGALATSHVWFAPDGDGLFHTPGNWWPSGPPGSNDTALFDLFGGPYAVSFLSFLEPSNEKLRMVEGNFVLNLNGATYTLTEPSTLPDSASIQVGMEDTFAWLQLDAPGTLRGETLAAGGGPDGVGWLHVKNGATLELEEDLRLGNGGYATLWIEENGSVTATGMLTSTHNAAGASWIYVKTGGSLTVDASFSFAGLIGMVGTSHITVEQGGEMEVLGTLYGSDVSSGHVDLQVSDPDSYAGIFGTLVLANTGSGEIHVDSGGQLEGWDAILTETAAATADVSVVDSGSRWYVQGDLDFGAGVADVSVDAGGEIDVGQATTIPSASQLDIGSGTFRTGTLSAVSGTVSWTYGSHFELKSSSLFINASCPLTGYVAVYDRQLTVSGIVDVSRTNGQSVLDTWGGTTTIGSDLYIARLAGESGRVWVEDPDASIDVGDDLFVGGGGQGTGGGPGGTGFVHIRAGGQLRVSTGTVVWPEGSIDMDGASSGFGTKTLQVIGGSMMQSTGQVRVGGVSIPNETVPYFTVDGSNAWVSVKDGGTLQTRSGRVGHEEGGALVAVRDGGQWSTTHSGNIDVGTTAQGRLEVGPDGTVSASNAVWVGDEGTLTLDGGTVEATIVFVYGNVVGSGTLEGFVVVEEGRLAPGGSPGLIEIAGGLAVEGQGTIEIDLGGLASVQYDRLHVESATLSGTLEISAIDGFEPQPGDLFEIITVTDPSLPVIGEFDTVVPSDLYEVVYTDLAVFVRARATCPGDLDGSGHVGFNDLSLLLGSWGSCPAECPSDLDGSGHVGFNDLSLLLGSWGTC